MFDLHIISAIVFLSLANLSAATDYCDPRLCTTNEKIGHHIGCKNTGNFKENCENPEIIGMTSKLATAILYTHNSLRNKVANGSLPGFATAKRMTTMLWDAELEYLAGLNLFRCELKHDECHNTPEYRWSGQNMAIRYESGTSSTPDYKSMAINIINEWFDEQKFAHQGDVDVCKESGQQKGIGHFTQIIQEKSSRLGCSIVKFVSTIGGRKWNTTLMACDYGFGNLLDFPIYTKGTMGSGCQTGANCEFNGLCAVSEPVRAVPDIRMMESPAPIGENQTHVEPIQVFQPDQPIPTPRTLNNPIGAAFEPEPPRPIQSSSPILSARSIPTGSTHHSTNNPHHRHSSNRRGAHPRTASPRISAVRRSSVPSQPPPPASQYRDLIQPLMPIPIPIVLIGRALQQVASFFIMP